MQDLQHVVQSVRDSRPWDFTTKAGLCAYSQAVIVALHQVDPNFGHLKKSEGQNHCGDGDQRHAVDAVLYRATGQIVDFIISAGYGNPPPDNGVAWGVGPEGEYSADSWFAPGAGGALPPGPGVPAPPSNLEARVAALEQTKADKDRVEAINARFAGESGQIFPRLDALEDRLRTAPAAPKKPTWWPF